METIKPARIQSLTEQTFWFATAKTIAFVLTLAAPLLLVRLLSQTELGLYKQAFLVAASAQRILTLGFGLSAFYFFPRMLGKEQPVVANIVILSAVMGLLAWVAMAASPPMLKSLFGTQDLEAHAGLLGAVVFLWVFSSFIEIAPAAMQETKASTILIVTMQVARMIFMVGAALWSASLTALLWAAVLQGVLQSAVLIRFLLTRFPGFWRCLSGSEFRVQFHYILPLTVAYFIGVISMDAPQYLVAHHFGPALYAVFTIATFQLPLIHILHESIGLVLMPTVSRLHHEGREREIVLVLVSAMRKTAAIAFPVFFGLVVVSQEFIIACYTRNYASATPLFAINLIQLPLTALIYEPLVRTFESVRKMLVLVRILLLLLLVVAVWLSTGQGSMKGAIYAIVVAAALQRITICGRMAHILGLTWRDARLFKDIGKITIACVSGSIVVWILKTVLASQGPWLILIVCGAVFCVVYVAGALLLKVPSQQEMEIGRRMLKRLLPKRLQVGTV